MSETQIQKGKPYPAKLEPMLAPNKLMIEDIPLSSLEYPQWISTKYNGIRALLMDGHFYSRTMSELKIHPILLRRYKPLIAYASENMLVQDGEFNSSTYNTVGETRSILAGTIPTPTDFQFKIFYSIPYSVWNGVTPMRMEDLICRDNLPAHCMAVRQTPISSSEDFLQKVDSSKSLNIEGFILLNPRMQYMHGRVAESKNPLRKYKYYGDDEDAKVVGLTPRRERNADTEGKQHETGYAKAVYTQDSFHDTEVAGTMVCFLQGNPEKVIYVPFPVGWDMNMRHRAYINFGTGSSLDIKGQWISFRRLRCEDRNKPVAIKKVQFRDSKD
jgi:hypothetical protein